MLQAQLHQAKAWEMLGSLLLCIALVLAIHITLIDKRRHHPSRQKQPRGNRDRCQCGNYTCCLARLDISNRCELILFQLTAAPPSSGTQGVYISGST